MTTLSSTLSVSAARANLYDLVDQVSTKFKRFVLTHKGQPKAVVLSPEEIASWEETIEIMNNPVLYSTLQQSIKEADAGQTVPYEQVIKNVDLVSWN